LEADKRFYILFDEPELSLNMMIWQKKLLPNICSTQIGFLKNEFP
jgi:hypothetical protein